MPDEEKHPAPEDDIQGALDKAHQLTSQTHQPNNPPLLSDTLTHAGHCPLLSLRYALSKCGLMAEKAPWQTMTALALTIGCGWLCSYFGYMVLAALVLYAIFAEE
jgi:hypothetical protein